MSAMWQASVSSSSKAPATLRTLCRTSTGRTSWVPSTPSSQPPSFSSHLSSLSIVVEFAKETRPRRDPYDADRAVRARRPPGFRVIVSGISRDTSWQVRSSSIPFFFLLDSPLALDTACVVGTQDATTILDIEQEALTRSLLPGPQRLRS